LSCRPPTSTLFPYTTLFRSGEPVVRGTRTPVRAIVELWRRGVAPEEIPKHLSHLNLAQVFDALSYYSDHTSEINAHIERNRVPRSEEHTSELQSPCNLVCRL